MRAAGSLVLTLLAASLVACTGTTSLTHPRPEPPGCRAQADGHAIICGGQVAATLTCTRWNYGACNVLILTYADGETVTLHELRGDAKFDRVSSVRVSSGGGRLWFTESDLSVWAMLRDRDGGMSHRSRVYDVWDGKLVDVGDEAPAGTVPLAPEPTPFGSSGAQLYKALREGKPVEVH